MRILAVDPGDKRIGIAVSDPTGTIASPLTVVNHTKRSEDAKKIGQIAFEKNVKIIIVGQTIDDDGKLTPQGRKSLRLAQEILKVTTAKVEMWDETSSTKLAKKSKLEMNVSRKKRRGHMDDIAATIILQSYLDDLRGRN